MEEMIPSAERKVEESPPPSVIPLDHCLEEPLVTMVESKSMETLTDQEDQSIESSLSLMYSGGDGQKKKNRTEIFRFNLQSQEDCGGPSGGQEGEVSSDDNVGDVEEIPELASL
eukprot:Gb_04461 [translate_table: standard]